MGLSYRQKRDIQEKVLGDFLSKATGKKNKDTLVIVPVYNEEHNIAQVINTLRKYVDHDILVVDDGSSDSTPGILRQIGVNIVTHPVNLRGNFSVFTALEAGCALGYDHIVKVDGDGQLTAEDAKAVAHLLQENSADIVIGSRYIGSKDNLVRNTRGLFSSIRNAGRLFSSKLVSILTGHKFTDATNGLRGWNKGAAGFLVGEFKKGCMSDDFTWDLELCIIAVNRGMRVIDMPAKANKRVNGESKEFGRIRMWAWPPHLILMLLRILVARLIARKSKGAC